LPLRGRAPVRVDRIGPVGDQAAGGDEVAERVDRRQSVPSREHSDQIAMYHRRCARRHDQWSSTAVERLRKTVLTVFVADI